MNLHTNLDLTDVCCNTPAYFFAFGVRDRGRRRSYPRTSCRQSSIGSSFCLLWLVADILHIVRPAGDLAQEFIGPPPQILLGCFGPLRGIGVHGRTEGDGHPRALDPAEQAPPLPVGDSHGHHRSMELHRIPEGSTHEGTDTGVKGPNMGLRKNADT